MSHESSNSRVTNRLRTRAGAFSGGASVGSEKPGFAPDALTEARAQQAATAEILKVIASSLSDAQPVFDVIVRSASRLIAGHSAVVTRVVGDELRLAALTVTSASGDAAVKNWFPMPTTLGVHGKVISTRAPVCVSDTETEPDPDLSGLRELARARGFRAALVVPLLRDKAVIGTISVTRREPGPFSTHQLDLLRTFADQAVIAIENVRLFNELNARTRELRVALEQQTAMSELLKAIGRSTLDLQPVFDTLIESAVRLCEAERGFVWRPDGEVLRAVVVHNAPPKLREFAEQNPIVAGRGSATARAALERQAVHIPDALADPEYTFGVRDIDPIRTALAIPMLRGPELLGVIAIYRLEARPFSDDQIALMEAFAGQAVIAIENVRLFKELQARTEALTRSVGQLTALGEVGQAISSTLDLETVLQTIVTHAAQLTGLDGGEIFEYDESAEQFHLHAAENLEAEVVEALRRNPVHKGEGAIGRTAVTGEPTEIPDIHDIRYQSSVRELLVQAGYRALLAVPLLREGHLLGALVVNRKAPGSFSTETVELLKTFAMQSTLAIQNARLFRQIADKSHQLEAASLHKSEFLANMSHELRTPLNAIIGFSEVLGERYFGELTEKQEEYVRDIYESGKHLLSLINDILDLSKIEAGKMVLEPAQFDLPVALQNALTLVKERAERHGIRLGVEVDPALGAIYADERKFKQIMLNLLTNAVKFTPDGGAVNVLAGSTDAGLEVSVTDTGAGIAPDDQSAVFEEFKQVGRDAVRKAEGTGLGLPLARRFVELHGGTIRLHSVLGQGSTFSFTIPFRCCR